MVRHILRFVTAVLLLGLILVAALATTADTAEDDVADPVTITSYAAQYDVTQDGTLRARETITGTFPWGRHGIFRYWDLADAANDGVRYPPKDVSFRLDGQPVPVSRFWEQGRRFRVAQIGDPNSYLTPGPHTYTISYRIDGALAPNTGRDRSEFVWQVVAAGWSMPIMQSDISVTLPHATDQVECSIGDGRPCTVVREGPGSLRISTNNLATNTPVILRATIQAPAPERTTIPWPIR